jgi:hypothetical protein
MNGEHGAGWPTTLGFDAMARCSLGDPLALDAGQTAFWLMQTVLRTLCMAKNGSSLFQRAGGGAITRRANPAFKVDFLSAAGT